VIRNEYYYSSEIINQDKLKLMNIKFRKKVKSKKYRKFKLGLIILIYSVNLNAQLAILNDNLTVKFQSARLFEIGIEEDLTLEYDFYNDSISIAIYPLWDNDAIDEFITNPSKTVTGFLRVICDIEIGEVKKIKHIPNAYYQLGESWIGNPVMQILIYNKDLDALINFDINCYESSIDEAFSILNSIELIKTK
jgi:hypothetical protein